MTFWTDSANLVPNQNGKFRVLLGGPHGTYGTFLIKSVDPMPSISTELIGGELNQEGTGYDPFHKQSVIKWNPITITFVNMANSDVENNLLYNWFQSFYNAGWNPINPSAESETGLPISTDERDMPSIIVSNAALRRTFDTVEIFTLHPDGYKISNFKLVEPAITALSVGGLSYDNDELHTYAITFIYAYCEFGAHFCT